MRVLLLILLTSVLQGCGLAVMAMRDANQPPHVTLEDDEFSRFTSVNGYELYDNTLVGPYRDWLLRSIVDKKDGTVVHQLYVETHYFALYPLFDSAADDEQTELEVTRIDRHTTDCTRGHREDCLFIETDIVAIDDTMLRRRASNGFRLKLYGHSGVTSVFEVTPQMIALQLDAVDKLRLGGNAVTSLPRQ